MDSSATLEVQKHSSSNELLSKKWKTMWFISEKHTRRKLTNGFSNQLRKFNVKFTSIVNDYKKTFGEGFDNMINLSSNVRQQL